MKEKLIRLRDSYRAQREKLIKKLEKPVKVLKQIFGWGIMISLFAGGMTILGYIFALCVGGELAESIAVAIKQYIIPAVTYTSTIMVLFGIIIMYLSGQTALSAKKKEKPTEAKADAEAAPATAEPERVSESEATAQVSEATETPESEDVPEA